MVGLFRVNTTLDFTTDIERRGDQCVDRQPRERSIAADALTAAAIAAQLGEVLNLDVKAFAVPRAGWAAAFEQFGIPKGHTGPAEEMFEAVNVDG